MTETTTMPSRKNIYIRHEDQDLLREFETNGGNASELFSKSLKRHIDEERDRKEREKAAQGEHGRIIVELQDQYSTVVRKKAFQGRWLVEPSQATLEDTGSYWGVAETKLGKIVVVDDDQDYEASSFFEVMTVDEFRDNENVPPSIKSNALQVLGEDFVEELDI